MDFHEPIALADPLERQSLQARVIWGNRIVTVGGGAPVRIVSPMPSCNKTESAAVDVTAPLAPMPASVKPKCKGYEQRRAKFL